MPQFSDIDDSALKAATDPVFAKWFEGFLAEQGMALGSDKSSNEDSR